MGFGYQVVSWDGNTINDGNPYSAQFLSEDSGVLDTPGAQAVENQRPRLKPVFSHAQPVSERFSMEVVFDGALSQANLDQLKQWFASENGQGYLVVTDDSGSGSNRRRLCLVEKVNVKEFEGNNVFEVQFYSDEYWEDVTATTPAATNITANGQQFTLTNPGDIKVPLVLTLTANAVSSTKQTKVRQTFIANRSREALTHFASEGYPIDITGGGIDTTSGVRSDLADLRVLLYGEYQKRTCFPATANAATKVWVNLAMQPGKFATLAADIDGSASSFEVDNPDGFARDDWPENDWLFVGTEAMQYVGRTTYGSGTLVRPNPTSHSAGDLVIWIEHIPEIIYGDSDSTEDDEDADTTPVIDLSLSSNTLHVLNGTFFNDEDRRSGTLLRKVASDGSQHIRCYTDGDGKLRWEDELPEAGKPALNRVEWRFPVPMTSLTFDYEVEQTLLLEMFGSDGEVRTELLRSFWTNGERTDQTITPALPMYSLEMTGRIAAINGVLRTGFSPSLQPNDPRSAQHRVDNPFFGQVLEQYKRVHEDVDNKSFERGFTVPFYDGEKQIPNGLISHVQMAITMPVFIRFTIEDDAEVAGFVMWATSDWDILTIYNSQGGIPGESITFATRTTLSGTGYKIYLLSGNLRTKLSAGEYFARPHGSFGVLVGRLHPDIWWGYHDVYGERTKFKEFTFVDFYDFPDIPEDPDSDYFHKVSVFGGGSSGHDITWDEYARVDIPTREDWHDDQFFTIPPFAVLSAEAPLGPNAPVETGFIATVDNLRATLDSDLAPLIFVEDAIDMLLVEGTIENETTGQAVDVVHVLPLTESLAIDTETGQATASETDFEVGYAVAFAAGLPDGLTLAPGSNTLNYTQAGIADLDIAASFRGRYL